MVFVFSESIGCVVVPRLHVVEADLSEVGKDDGAELAAEEAVDEGVHRRVAVADPQDNAAEKDRNQSLSCTIDIGDGYNRLMTKIVQGDTSGCDEPPVDCKTKVPF